MKITLLGSLGHINQHVIPELIKQGHEVTVVSHSDKRTAEIESLGAHAAIGSMSDIEFLSAAFAGADEVYLMISGDVGRDGNPVESARQQAEIFKTAITQAGVKRVVDLSSVGADQGPEVGGLYVYHVIEDVLKELPDVLYTFVRPTGFYTNLLTKIPLLKEKHIIVESRGAEVESYWVAPEDIAQVVLKALLTPTKENRVMYATSDRVKGAELVQYIADEIQMPDLKWVEISDQEMEQSLAANMPAPLAKAFTTMYAQERTPEFYADLHKQNPQLGQVKMGDFMKTFGEIYRQA